MSRRGLALPAAAWLLHLLAAYAIAEFGCLGGWGDAGVIRALAAVTVLALAASLAGWWAAWRTWRSASAGGVASFAGRAGVLLGGLFTLVILAQALPIGFYRHGC